MRALDEMRIEHAIKTGTKGGLQADNGLGRLALLGVGHAGAFVRAVEFGRGDGTGPAFGDPVDLQADGLDKVARMNVGPVEVAFAQQTFVPRDNPVGMRLCGIDQEFQHARGESPPSPGL